jgi:hypothetical protein
MLTADFKRLVLFLFAFLTLSFIVTIGTMIAALIIIARKVASSRPIIHPLTLLPSSLHSI